MENKPTSSPPGNRRRNIGLMLGITAFVVMLASPPPDTLSIEGWRTAAIAVLMAVFWASEAMPVPATALVPLVAFPLLGVSGIKATAAPYGHPLIFLFLGGFLLALGMQRWNLHRRIALHIVSLAGGRPHALVMAFMVATAFLSMWVSNTATTMMMLPVAVSVIAVLADSDDVASAPVRHNFSLSLMLGIAYAASIGGLGTLVGTPPNALLAAFFSDTYGIEIGFAEWMMIGVPVVLIMLPLTWLLLTRLIYPFELKSLGEDESAVTATLRYMGDITVPEKRVGMVFLFVALFWICRPLLNDFALFKGLTDTGIAIGGALLLFLLPSGERTESGAQAPLLGWEGAKELPWGVLVLFGGGLSLAGAFSRTGLAEWIGSGIEAAGVSQTWAVILIVVALVIFLTELTSNTATTATLLPVLGSVAAGMGIAPLELAVPAALAASCAFMLPVATPPNAIVFGSGHVTIPEMVRAGLLLNLLGIMVITLFANLALPAISGL